MGKIKSFKIFNENTVKPLKSKLLYFCFDWDDNILHMPTVIHMDKLVDGKWVPTDVPTDEFAIVRTDKINWRISDDNPDKAFSNFRDVGPLKGETFITDVKKALNSNDFSPSWNTFLKCMENGSLFAIITSRGHEPESIRKAVEYIIDNHLTDEQQYTMYQNCLKFVYLFSHKSNKDYDRLPRGQFSKCPLINDYLDECGFYGIQSKYVENLLGKFNGPEVGKELCMKDFVEKIHKFGKEIGSKISVGFSDDDLKFSEHMEKYFKNELSLKYVMNYHVYDTSKKDKIREIELKMQESAINSGTPGKEGSILPFTKWGNMTKMLYPQGPDNRQDDTNNRYNVSLNQDLDLYMMSGVGFKRKSKANEKKINERSFAGDFISDVVSYAFERRLNIEYGKGNWVLNSSPFDCGQKSIIPDYGDKENVTVDILDRDNQKKIIGKLKFETVLKKNDDHEPVKLGKFISITKTDKK